LSSAPNNRSRSVIALLVVSGIVEHFALLNFVQSENILFRKFFSNFVLKIQNLGIKILILGDFWDRIEMLTTHNLLCRKFATACSSAFLIDDSTVC